MQIKSDTNSVRCTATEGQTDFYFTFPVYMDTHLVVYVGTEVDDVIVWSLQTLASQYSMVHTDTEKKTGKVVFVTGLEAGQKVLILRQVPLIQESEYTEDDRLPAKVIEADINLGVMIDQQHGTALKKCFKLPETSEVENLVVPEPEANKFLMWLDSQTLVNRELPDPSILVLPLGVDQGGTGATTPAAARAGLGAVADDDAVVWAKAQSSGGGALPISTGAVAWDMEAAQYATLILSEEVTAMTPSNHTANTPYVLIVKQDGTGGYTLDLTEFLWPDGEAPEIPADADAVTILSFISDGTNLYGWGTGLAWS